MRRCSCAKGVPLGAAKARPQTLHLSRLSPLAFPQVGTSSDL
jgi:hypothetical protein